MTDKLISMWMFIIGFEINNLANNIDGILILLRY
jgi:hypothetical protein